MSIPSKHRVVLLLVSISALVFVSPARAEEKALVDDTFGGCVNIPVSTCVLIGEIPSPPARAEEKALVDDTFSCANMPVGTCVLTGEMPCPGEWHTKTVSGSYVQDGQKITWSFEFYAAAQAQFSDAGLVASCTAGFARGQFVSSAPSVPESTRIFFVRWIKETSGHMTLRPLSGA